MKPVIMGLTIPGTVATVFDSPIIKLAYCGAISKWFTLFGREMEDLNDQNVVNL